MHCKILVGQLEKEGESLQYQLFVWIASPMTVEVYAV